MARINPTRSLPRLLGDHIFSRKGSWFSGRGVNISNSQSWSSDLHGLHGLVPRLESISLGRLRIAFLFLLLIGFAITWRLFFLQVVKGKEYHVLSERNRMYVRMMLPERGVIYDRNGEVVARNIPAFSANVVYSEIPLEKRDVVKQQLKEVLALTEDEIMQVFSVSQLKPFEETLLKRNIPYEQRIALETRIAELPGVHITQDTIRSYPKGDLFAAVLGYTGTISPSEIESAQDSTYIFGSLVGKDGFEGQYEDVLYGKIGRTLVEIDAQGTSYQESIVQAPVPGRDVRLTLDAKAQQKLKELLLKKMDETKSYAASAVIADPLSGEIIAMVSLPTYDNNMFFGSQEEVTKVLTDPRSLLLNRALHGMYSPGSTVKMAIGAWALEKNVIQADTRISGSPQVISINGFEFPDWTRAYGRPPHGMMDLPGALAVSSDIFFYKVGGGFPPECKISAVRCEISGLNVSGVVESLRKFGFGSKTHIDLPNEVAGLVPDPTWKQKERSEPWYLGNTYHLSIGQGDLLASPLQVLHLTNIMASDDDTPQLHVMKDDDLVRAHGLDSHPEKPVSPENLAIARSGMVEAVTEGIIYPLRGASYTSAAKTGTAEFGTLNAKGEYATHAWVTGYAPLENPEVSFVFMMESGGKSEFAAQIAREFLDWYMNESR